MSRFLLNLPKTFNIKFIKKYSTLNSNAIEHLKSIVGSNNYSITEAVRLHHAKDESLHE